MKTSQIDRAALLRIAGLVRPALAAADYIPALTHIQFADGFATAYNDISAISVTAAVELGRCVPGDLLIRALGSFPGEHVSAALDPATGALLLTSGRSKIKLPTLAPKEFPFEVPTDVAPEVGLSPTVLRGIELCLMSAGSDATHPAQMGVTLEAEGGLAVLHSTDNYSISRAATDTPVTLPGDTPVILPTFLCEQVLSLSRAFPKAKPVLVLLPGALLVDFVDGSAGSVASVFSKTVIDVEPIDFPSIIRRHVDTSKARGGMVKIPDALDAAFGRALLVLSHEPAKTSTVSVSAGVLTLSSDSDMGQSDDEVPFDHPDARARIDPALVVRGLKRCTRMALTKKVLLLGDDTGGFLHLISYVA